MSKMPKIYKEKPLIVYAMRYTSCEDVDILKTWCETYKINVEKTDENFLILTNENDISEFVELGDYVVRDIDKNIIYSCSPKIFEKRFAGVEEYA